MTTFRISQKAIQACCDIGTAIFEQESQEMLLSFQPEGSLHIVAVAISKVAMVSAEIPLLTPPPAPLEQFFPLKQLKLAAEALSDLDELDASWNGEKAELTFKSGRRRRTIKSVVPTEGVRPKLPPLPLDISTEVPIDWLKRCTKGSRGIGYACVQFTIQDGRLVWKNEDELGGYDDDVEVKLPEGSPAPAPWSYSKEYLACISDMATGKVATLNFSSQGGIPLMADVPLAAGRAKFLLAPMI